MIVLGPRARQPLQFWAIGDADVEWEHVDAHAGGRKRSDRRRERCERRDRHLTLERAQRRPRRHQDFDSGWLRKDREPPDEIHPTSFVARQRRAVAELGAEVVGLERARLLEVIEHAARTAAPQLAAAELAQGGRRPPLLAELDPELPCLVGAE